MSDETRDRGRRDVGERGRACSERSDPGHVYEQDADGGRGAGTGAAGSGGRGDGATGRAEGRRGTGDAARGGGRPGREARGGHGGAGPRRRQRRPDSRRRLVRLGTTRFRERGVIFTIAYGPDGKTLLSAGFRPTAHSATATPSCFGTPPRASPCTSSAGNGKPSPPDSSPPLIPPTARRSPRPSVIPDPAHPWQDERQCQRRGRRRPRRTLGRRD